MSDSSDSVGVIAGGKVKSVVNNYFDHVASQGLYGSRKDLYLDFFSQRDKQIILALQDLGLNKLRVLDAGCGDGSGFLRLRKELSNLEISYKGFDLSKKMLAKARLNKLDVSEADLIDLKLFDSGGFDVVLSLFGSIGYLGSETERQLALQEFRRVLDDKGLLILDVFYRNSELDCTYCMEDDGNIGGGYICLVRGGLVNYWVLKDLG